jgi:hypothetical protein
MYVFVIVVLLLLLLTTSCSFLLVFIITTVQSISQTEMKALGTRTPVRLGQLVGHDILVYVFKYVCVRHLGF